MLNLPLTGVMSGCWTNHWDGLSLAKSKLLAHTCTVSPARPLPPLTVKLACCSAVALVVSMIVLQSVPPLRTRVSYAPSARLPCRNPLPESTYFQPPGLPDHCGQTNWVNCAI